LDSGSKEVYLPDGTYLTGTLTIPAGVTLHGNGPGSVLSMKAHNTTHNPVLRIGNSAVGANNITVRDLMIDGNSSLQTYTNEEWSPGIMVWGSNYATMKNLVITDCKGDGITIGYDSARLTGSNANIVDSCEVYGNSRNAIAITWGNENHITSNRVTGTIDVEADPNFGEAKNNIVMGNTGRSQTESLGAPRISDLAISTATQNTDQTRTSGNKILGNVMKSYTCEYNDGVTLFGNTIIGSSSSTVRLIELAGCDNVTISSNDLIANTAVATSLTDIIRTRACSYLNVINNNVSNDNVVFHNYTALTYGAETAVAGSHNFRGNMVTGSGSYRNTTPLNVSEWGMFRLDQTNGGTLDLTQIAGVPIGISAVRSTTTAIITLVSGGTLWKMLMNTGCNATQAASDNQTHLCVPVITHDTSNKTITMYTFAPAADNVVLSAFGFDAGGGTGTFWFEAWW
jgi:hypothetical protein